jgi:hypothetical protein
MVLPDALRCYCPRDDIVSRAIQASQAVFCSGMFAPANVQEYKKPSLFERLPSARKRLLGFDPHSLEELGRYGLIRIIEVVPPGRRFAIKLVHIPSLIAYVERLEELADLKRQAEIRAGYAHHHPKGALEEPKIAFLESSPQPEQKP